MPDARVAVICLAPASGHLISLLKIASKARECADVIVIVPDELTGVAERHGFHAEGFGPVRPEGGDWALQAYIHSSEPARVMGKFRTFDRKYLLPLQAAVRRSFARVGSILSRHPPTCILADDALPFFRKELTQLSVTLDVPVMFHDSALHHNTWSHRSCYFHDVGSFVRDAVEKTKNEALLLLKGWPRRITLSEVDPADCFSAFRFPRVLSRVTYLASGTRFLEKCLLSDYLLHSDVERLVLPTLPPLEGQLEAELVSWLGTAQRSVVYISLGTIIRNGEILADLVRGVLRCGERVLVQGDAPELSGFDRNEVRQEVWLPQATAIAHPAVSLVITHGGSGSVEEALWNGKPLLCVPHAWDQYYNAWIASKLGVAVCVSKTRRASRPGFHLAVAKASGEPFRDNAQSIARIMHRCWQENEDAVADLFRTPAVGS